MAQVLRIEVRLSDGHWAGDLTRLFPESLLRIEEHMPLGKGRGTATASIRTRDADSIKDSLEGSTSIEDLSVWEKTEHGMRFRVEIPRGGGGFIRPLMEVGLVPRTPFDVRDGWVDWTIECQQVNASELLMRLSDAEIPHRVLSIRSGSDESLLTPRQRQVFELALAEGYFDKPRRIDQAGMARILGISRSTLNEIVQGMESRVMKGLAGQIRGDSS